jgi:hypothetical protein
MTLWNGVDLHPHQQTAAWCDRSTGEVQTASSTILRPSGAITQGFRTVGNRHRVNVQDDPVREDAL